MTVLPASTIWRDYVVDGVPSSGAHDPEKPDIRALLAWVESGITAGTLNGPWEASVSALNAKLNYAAGNPGFVYEGSGFGTYRKSGASGTGSWVKILDTIPGYQVAKGNNVGAGTANAIVATSEPPVSYSDGKQIISVNITTTNTSEDVTVNFNGLGALAIRTASNNKPAVGGLVAPVRIWGQVDQSGTVFRLISDQASTAVLAGAEAAQAAAEVARDQAVAAASSVTGSKATIAAAEADDPLVDPDYYDIAYRASDFIAESGGKYRKQVSEPTHALKFQNDNGTWYGFEGSRLTPQMFGALGVSAAADTAIFQNMFATAVAIGATECDARAITGTITFTEDIFDGIHTLPVVFRTGKCTIKMNFNNSGGFKIPSFCDWVCEGTKIKPTVAITNIGGENSPGAAMVQTYFGGDDGRTATGTGTGVTVSDATGIHVGTQLSIFGTRRANEFQYELGSGITAGTTIIPIVNTGVGEPPVSHSDPGMIIMRIGVGGGVEFVRGLYTGGNLDTTVAGGGRGLYGTTAASHSSGAACLLMLADPKRVVAMSGTSLTLDSALDNACNGNPLRFGAVGARLRGDVEIDGEFDRAAPPANLWHCLGGTLTAGPFCEGSVRLKRGSHGGAFFMGTRDLVAEIEKIESCGYPATSLGASVWVFGTNQNHHIHVKEVRDGNIAAALDNKSSGIVSLNLASANRYGTTLIDRILSHKDGFDVTASFDQYCWAGYSECSASHAGIFDGMPQQWTALTPTNVTIVIDQMHTFRAPTSNGGSLVGNVVMLEGKTGRDISATITLGATTVSYLVANLNVTYTLTGAKVGDHVTVNPLSDLASGVAISGARISSNDNLRLQFINIASTADITGLQIRARAVGPW